MTAAPPPSPVATLAVRGTFWSYVGYYGGKSIAFITTLVLVRLLSKDDFGLVGYATTTLGLVDVLRDMGIGPALIYHRDEAEVLDTAFWLVVATALALLALAALGLAPLANLYFGDARAGTVIAVLALTYPINALSTVHEALLNKHLKFQLRFVPDFVYAISKGGFSILLAWAGWGPWSLILGPIVAASIQTIVAWSLVPWRPRLRFAGQQARILLHYGLHTVIVNAAGMLVLNIDYLLVGRLLGPAILGTYIIAFRIPELLILQFCYIVARVIFPVYSSLRDDPEALRRGFLKTLTFVPLVTIPMGLGLALVAPAFVRTLFPADWLDAAPVIQAIAIYALLLSLAYNAGDVYKAQGRPALLTWLTVFRLVLLAPGLWWAITRYNSIMAVAWVQAGVAAVGGLLNIGVACRMLQIPGSKVAAALWPAFAGGLVMSVAVYFMLDLTQSLSGIGQLLLGCGTGVLAYGGTLLVINPRLVQDSWGLFRKALPGK